MKTFTATLLWIVGYMYVLSYGIHIFTRTFGFTWWTMPTVLIGIGFSFFIIPLGSAIIEEVIGE